MQMNLLPFIVLWILLACTVLAMVVWRKSVSSHEDDSLHVAQGPATEQISLAHKLEVIDRWGKILTVVTVVSGLALGALYVYQSWVVASNIPQGL